jgi:chromosome segregation ATPase
MQDWERTQELATEAQDSAGASAAQYAKYAEGMEAAMTRLQTSWQSFTQSLVNSQSIITIVNLGTKLLSGVTNFIESGNPIAKSLLSIVTGVLVAYGATNKLAKSLNLENSKEEQYLLRKLDQERIQAELQADEKINAEKLTEEQKKQVAELEEQIRKQRELNEIERQLVSLENDKTLTDKERDKERAILENRKSQIPQPEQNIAISGVSTKQQEDITNAINSKLDAENKFNDAAKRSNSTLIAQQKQILSIALAKKNTALAEKKTLEDQRKSVKTTKEKLELDKKIKQKSLEIQQANDKIAAVQDKINYLSTHTLSLYKQIGSSISMSITSGLRNVFSFLGPIGTLLGDILAATTN